MLGREYLQIFIFLNLESLQKKRGKHFSTKCLETIYHCLIATAIMQTRAKTLETPI